MNQPARSPETTPSSINADRDPHRPPQSSIAVYVFLGCSSFCVTALVVVALTSGSATAAGSIGAVWAATCGVLGLKNHRST
jgi:hypothetical protein